MLTIHHLNNSRSQRILWLCEELGIEYELVKHMRDSETLLEALPQPWTHEAWEAGMRALAEDLGLKAGDVFMMLRVAASGSTASPPLFESLETRLNYSTAICWASVRPRNSR